MIGLTQVKARRLPVNNTAEGSLVGVIKRAISILELGGIKGSQATLALDKIYKSYTGISALEVAGIHLETIGDKKLLTPAKVGQALGIHNRALAKQIVNYLLADNEFQYRTMYSWMPLEKGYPYAAICDTKETAPDGKIITTLKWTEDIIPILKKILEDYN